ncbi:hypothetical protein Poli38472_009436 [Pythium oligandrum]|uniref:RNA helicase n=1 Tax=Pythium oligandrum TaxID=41045 RepID=A0A8K1CG70_PYTOL|nr:hypothetical protein Poli38472_009436 [Pythium oligandrum]|eukprot:TMW61943.1 hypothetical protein Poli38472_009436 [Pythium oligandrum]
MAMMVDGCVRLLRAFVENHGGCIAPEKLGEFYNLHPNARALMRPTARAFVERHGAERGVVWRLDQKSNRSTITAGQQATTSERAAPSGQKLSANQKDVMRKLHAFILTRGGQLAPNFLGEFYQTMPTAREVMIPKARVFITTYGSQVPGIQVKWVVNGKDAVIVASTTLVPTATRNPPPQQSNATPWRQCLELLDDFVKQRKDCRASMSALGIFCKQNPSVASILRPNKSILSCQAFIDKYGQKNGFKLTWQANPPVVVRGANVPTTERTASQVIQITSVKDATAVVQKKLQQAEVIAIDMEGDLSANGRSSLLQIALRSNIVYIFDILTCPAILSNSNVGLGAVLANSSIVKVIHDGRNDALALLGQFGVTMANVFDTQVAYWRLHGTSRMVGINTVLEEYAGQRNAEKDNVQHRPGLWEQRPLPPKLLDYAAQDVQFSIRAFDKMTAKMSAQELQRCLQSSIDRMKIATLPAAGKTATPVKTSGNQRLSKLVRQNESVFRGGNDGIEVVDNDPDAFRNAIDENVAVRKVYTIKNNGTRAAQLLRVAFVASSNALPFFLPNPVTSPRTLEAGRQIDISVGFRSAQPGSFRAILTFKLSSAEGETIDIMRIMDNVNCVSAMASAALRAMIEDAANASRYQRKKERTRPGYVVDAFAWKTYPSELAIRIPEHKMSKTFALTTKKDIPLMETTYVQRFQQMLWQEERQQHIQQQDYDMIGAVLDSAGRSYRLTVPGLAESRPSVLGGDKVLLVHKGKTYQARAVDVTRDYVVLGAPRSFINTYQRNDRVDVRFCLSRVPMRLCHQGVVAYDTSVHRKFLFPTKSAAAASAISDHHDLRYTRELNPEQMQAVRDLQRFDQLSAPYIIFGPPGTGKTTTLVESVVQIALANPTSRILMCAATNTAADLLVDRLARFVPQGRMLRVMGAMRKEQDTLASVLPYTLRDGDGGFQVPSLDELTKSSLQIVVATLVTGAKLHNFGIRRGHFRIVAIDEAGQATEPEVMSVLGPLLLPTTALILAGDPQQLGPVIKSPAASEGGLGISLLERLVSFPVYKDTSTHLDARVITKLRRNYRAHPVLLTVPSTLFYEGSLLACASPATCRGLENWTGLPTPGAPLIFHGVQGTDSQDANSPSWFNPQEIVLVHAYVDLLLSNRAGMTRQVQPGDIGIITPYAKQRSKIHQILNKSGIQGVRVGSVEQFQGAELPVIIVSTVRSSRDFFDEDAKFHLGFLGNPKRFNVAITRAQSLLIVIGNPFVLEADPNWATLLRHCRALGAWKGAGKPMDGPDVTKPKAEERVDMIHPSAEEVSSCALM